MVRLCLKVNPTGCGIDFGDADGALIVSGNRIMILRSHISKFIGGGDGMPRPPKMRNQAEVS